MRNIKVSKRLIKIKNVNVEEKAPKISKTDLLFRIVFEVKLDNGFELKDMREKHIQDFHKFLSDTVYKGLTISQVDKLFLRKQGLSNAPSIMSMVKNFYIMEKQQRHLEYSVTIILMGILLFVG